MNLTLFFVWPFLRSAVKMHKSFPDTIMRLVMETPFILD